MEKNVVVFRNWFSRKPKRNAYERLTELLEDDTKNARGLRRDVDALQARTDMLEKGFDEMNGEAR